MPSQGGGDVWQGEKGGSIIGSIGDNAEDGARAPSRLGTPGWEH